jgi:hypothetical protein
MVEAISFALFFGIAAGALTYCLSQLATHPPELVPNARLRVGISSGVGVLKGSGTRPSREGSSACCPNEPARSGPPAMPRSRA